MTDTLKTLGSRLNSAQICRHNGWAAGTELVALEAGMRRRLRIVEVRDSHVMAVAIDVDDQPLGEPALWDVTVREWVEGIGD